MYVIIGFRERVVVILFQKVKSSFELHNKHVKVRLTQTNYFKRLCTIYEIETKQEKNNTYNIKRIRGKSKQMILYLLYVRQRKFIAMYAFGYFCQEEILG